MDKPYVPHFSVYRVKDDMPIFIHGTVYQCAKAMGIAVGTFECYASRQKNGKGKGGQSKYEIVRDEE